MDAARAARQGSGVAAALLLTALVAPSARADEIPPTARDPAAAPLPEDAAMRDVGPLRPLRWEGSRFTTLDYVVTGAAAAVTLTAAIVTPLPGHFRGGVLFDDGVRNALRLGSPVARYTARDGSDVGLSLAATWPIFVDSLTTAWWYRGSRDVAQEIALIDLEALAVAGAFQGATNLTTSRERPYGRDCGGELPSATADCNGTSRFRSFFSGHATFSFTSAALICVHHTKLELLGAPYDAISCGVGYAVATTTAALRVAGDMHYATDVLTGALVGTLIGYGIPLLHYGRSTADTTTTGGLRVHVVPSPGGAGVVGTF